MANAIDQAFEHAKKEMNGLKAISLVEVSSGLSHGSLIIDTKFDLDAASAYNAEVLKAKIKAKNAMGMTKENIDIIIIELSSQLHMILPLAGDKYLIYAAADKSSSNIGIARKVVMEVADMIKSTIK
jgi:hypothetical protein